MKKNYNPNDNFFFNILSKINYTLLFIFVCTIGSTIIETKAINYSMGYWFLVLICAPISSIIVFSVIESKHEFFEWDKIERKKKKDFQRTSFFAIMFFMYVSHFVLFSVVFDLFLVENLTQPIITYFILKSFFGLVMLLNAIYTVELHFVIYEEYLTLNYQISKMPDDWEN